MWQIVLTNHKASLVIAEFKSLDIALKAIPALVKSYFGEQGTFRADQSLFGGYYAHKLTGETIELK